MATIGDILKVKGSKVLSIGPDAVVLEVPRGASVSDTQKPGLYLVLDLPPSSVAANELDGAA